MIRSISFENYRIFRNRQVLNLKPITIVFGKNNSGKSAVIKLPVLVRSSISCKSAEVFDTSFMERDFVKDLRGLVYNRGTKSLSIAIKAKSGSTLDYSFFIDEQKPTKTKIDSWSMETNGVRYAYVTGLDGGYLREDTKDPVVGLSFNGVMPSDAESQEFFKKNIDELNFQIDYIGAFRKSPEPYFPLSTLTECSGIGGEKNYNHLISDSKTQNHILCDKVSKWFEANFDGCGIFVNDREPVYSIELKHSQLAPHNVVDAGVGITQSLPIVIRACRLCSEPTLIILEEPETHLHPAAHGNLAQLLAESTMEDKNKSYLIETHSINFIMRIRRMIAEGKLSSGDVALYYVEYNEINASSNLKLVDINEDGSVKYWPKGVFEETLQETIAIKKAQVQQ